MTHAQYVFGDVESDVIISAFAFDELPNKIICPLPACFFQTDFS